MIAAGGTGTRSAHCPTGTKVIGGGADVIGKNTATVLSQSFPYDDGDGGIAPDNGWRASLDSRSAGSKTLVAYAVCTTARHLKYVETIEQGIVTGGHTTVLASCPNGYHVTGGGGAIQLPDVNRNVDIASTWPVDALSAGWETTFNNYSGSSQAVATFAVCALSGTYQYVQPSQALSPSDTQLPMAVDCPGSSKIVGGGAQVTGGGPGDVYEIAATFPSDGLDGNSRPDDAWSASANDVSSAAPLTMHLFAICKGA